MRSWIAKSLLLPMAFYFVSLPTAKAQIIPYQTTNIRGQPLTGVKSPCGAATCVVTGGDRRGRNLFYMFREFDTRLYADMKQLRFHNRPQQRVWIGVGEGPAVINKTIKLDARSNLTFLSPYGIALLNKARLSNINWAGFVRAAGFRFLDGSEFIPDTASTPALGKGAIDPSADVIKLDQISGYSELDRAASLKDEFSMVFVGSSNLRATQRLSFADMSSASSTVFLDKASVSVPFDKRINVDSQGRSARLAEPGRLDIFSEANIRFRDSRLAAPSLFVQSTKPYLTKINNSNLLTSQSQQYNGSLDILNSRIKSLGNIEIYGEDSVRLQNTLLKASPKAMRAIGNILIQMRNPLGSLSLDSRSTLDVSGNGLAPDGGNILLSAALDPKRIQIDAALKGQSASSGFADGNLFAYYLPKQKLKNIDHLSRFYCYQGCEEGRVADQVFRDISGTELAATALSDVVFSRATASPLVLDSDLDEFLQERDQVSTARAVALLGLEYGIDYQSSLTPASASIQESLRRAREQLKRNLSAYEVNPAVLYISFTPVGSGGDDSSGFIDLVAIPCCAKPFAARVPVELARLRGLLKHFYASISSDVSYSLGGSNSDPVVRELYAILFEPIDGFLKSHSVDTVLVFPDQNLQALPLGALHDGLGYLASRYTFSISPSLALANFPRPTNSDGRLLYLSSLNFQSLPALPGVVVERRQLSGFPGIKFVSDEQFTPQSFAEAFSDKSYSSVHVSAHADFSLGNPLRSLIHTSQGGFSINQFRELRLRRVDHPLNLFALGACRTALGDPLSELGFSGLALQAGSRTAIGGLWYVDDLITSVFFIQFYKLIEKGATKLEAYRQTQRAFLEGHVKVADASIVGLGDEILVPDLNALQREKYRIGLSAPYYWAGIQMIGMPW